MGLMFTKKCLICKAGTKNDCLYWHKNPDSDEIWVWCQGRCQRGYSLLEYCNQANIDLASFLKQDFDFIESKPNEVRAMAWPSSFIPLSDPRAQPGVDYLKGVRKLHLEGDMYYDMDRNGIVFPYYFGNHFCGAQIRLIIPKDLGDGEFQKMDTIPGTRLGLLFGLWNQSRFVTNIKVVGICEGYFNALSLQQAFNRKYGGIANNPWKFVCTSGSGISEHQKETIKELKEQGIKTIAAMDTDLAGLKGLKKLTESGAISHYAITGDTEKDWNDKLKELSHEELAMFFLKNIHKI